MSRWGLIVQRHGIVHRGLLLLEGFCSRLAVLHQRYRAIRQPSSGVLRLGDQLRIRGGIVFPVVDSLDAVAIIKAEGRQMESPATSASFLAAGIVKV